MREAIGIVGSFLLCLSPILTGCETPVDREWTEEDGYRWAPLSPGVSQEPGFARLSSGATGVDFENTLTDREIDENQHYLNGSGVAAGDVDGDGWVDLYFAQLNGRNRLYMNAGGLEFREVTDSANVAHEGYYSTGVTFADLDGDSDLDLLVGSMSKGIIGYINDGSGQFTRWSKGAIETEKGNSTLALADIDGDADLDLYVTNYKERSAEDLYSRDEIATENIVRRKRVDGGIQAEIVPPFDEHFAIVGEGAVQGPAETGEIDALYLNEGDGRVEKVESDSNHFRTATGEPGGLAREWGLNASFQDINQDGRPDLYVNNDFWTPDRIWINQGGGVFRELERRAVRNQSFSSMTVDFTDLNRNGALDLFVTEMLSPSHGHRLRQHTPEGPFPADRIESQPQYNRNSLYLNRGDNTFAEIAYYSGVEATGWSWGVRFLDVDLDGFEDLLVNTGFSHDVQDMDSRRKMGRKMSRFPDKRFITEYPRLDLPNEAFRNEGDLTFSRKKQGWGYGTDDDVSHGLATADLDKDGDLDLVVNRLNEAAGVYENQGTASRIAVQLSGRAPNTHGIGATVRLEGGKGEGTPQQRELTAGGDYLSGSTPTAVFAADPKNANHTIRVEWPNEDQTVVDSARANRIYEIEQPARSPVVSRSDSSGSERENTRPRDPLFEDVSKRLSHTHHENEYDDYRLQPLLPIKLSEQGPGLSWIDYDGDGAEDLVIGTGKGGELALYENDGAGGFDRRRPASITDTALADQTTIVGWPTEDGARMIVGTSNYEVQNPKRPSARQYLAEGDTVARRKPIPGTWSATGPMAAADYDQDGDLDLFVGGRIIRGQYPWDASSRVFNNQNGKFTVDESNSDSFSGVGLVTGAVFTDIDGDGDPDVLLSRAWDSLALYRNDEGTFRDVTEEMGLDGAKGWWNGVTTGDFTGNGLLDIVATNLGSNSAYQTASDHPLRMYYSDFNGDRRGEIIEAYYDPDTDGYVPRRKRTAYESTPVPLTSRADSYRQFATSSLEELLDVELPSLSVKEINTVKHTVFVNKGDHFDARPLPKEAQLTAAFHAGVADYNADGCEDLFLSQNFFGTRPTVPRVDAGRGLWLEGNEEGKFEVVPGQVSGIEVYGEQRGAALGDFNDDGRVDLAVSQNNARTKLYANRAEDAGVSVRLEGPPSNLRGVGSSIRVVYDDGSAGPRREVRAGDGYWSQRSLEHILGRSGQVDKVSIQWFDGRVDTVDVSSGSGDVSVAHPEVRR